MISGWTEHRLGELIQEVKLRNEREEKLRVLSVTNTNGFVESEEFFERRVYSKDLSNYKIVHRNQFAYNPSRINVGSLARLKNQASGLLSPMYIVFEAKEGADPDFLDQWFSSEKFRNLVKASTQGTVRDSLNYSSLAAMRIKLPPLPEQHRIATILNSMDKMIQKTNALIESLVRFNRAMRHHLIRHGLPGMSVKYRETLIGAVPGHWAVEKLRDLGTFNSGFTLNESRVPRNFPRPYLRVANVHQNRFLLDEIKYLEAFDEEFCDKQIRQNDLLFVEGHANISKLGRCALATAEVVGMTHQNHLHRFSPDIRRVNPSFITHSLCLPRIRRLIELEGGTSSGLHTLSQRSIASIPMPVPPLEEQNRIAGILGSIEAFERHSSSTLDRLEILKREVLKDLLGKN